MENNVTTTARIGEGLFATLVPEARPETLSRLQIAIEAQSVPL